MQLKLFFPWIGGKSMASLHLIYENGVFRPLEPLNMAEGTRVEAELVSIAEPERQAVRNGDKVDEEQYLAFLKALDEIAEMPLESDPWPYAAEEHDAILYPKQGKMP
jgi:predicted DNA-binding antitoxin AbrB/MazE fold protein